MLLFAQTKIAANTKKLKIQKYRVQCRKKKYVLWLELCLTTRLSCSYFYSHVFIDNICKKKLGSSNINTDYGFL